jgi:4-amino-4-deoxy-L-arabinose transferase-like glycosyltransferase
LSDSLHTCWRRSFGRVAGLLAAFLWFTLPVAIGYSHLNMLDVPFALVAVGGSLVLLRHLRSPTWADAAWVGLVGGVGLLSRWTALVFVPILAVVVFISARRRIRRAALQAGCVVLIAWLTLWGGYRDLAPSSTQVTDGLLRTYFGVSEQSLRRAPLGERTLESLPFPKEYTTGIQTFRVIAR